MGNKPPYILLALLCALLAGPARADVEVNMDVLGNLGKPQFRPPSIGTDTGDFAPLTAPVLFGSPPVPARKPEPEKQAALAVLAPEPEPPALAPEIIEALAPSAVSTPVSLTPRAALPAPPLPSKKPAHAAPKSEPAPPPPVEEDIFGEQLTIPDARMVLASIGPKAIPGGAPGKLSLGYPPGASELPEKSRENMIGGVLSQIGASSGRRVEIRAFAAKTDETPGSARRLSLVRALDVRNLLINNQVDPKIIDIRVMGENAGGGPADRVDIVFID